MKYPASPLLTERQLEILGLVAEGRKTFVVGNDLHISDSTVKRDLKHACITLRADNNTHAVAICVGLGLIEPKINPYVRRAYERKDEAPPQPNWLVLLTNRQKHVLELLAENPTNAEIQNILGIGFNTLRTHLRGIYKKLNITGSGEQRRSKLVELAQDVFHQEGYWHGS